MIVYLSADCSFISGCFVLGLFLETTPLVSDLRPVLGFDPLVVLYPAVGPSALLPRFPSHDQDAAVILAPLIVGHK